MKFVWTMDDYTNSEIVNFSYTFTLDFIGLAEPTTKISDFSYTIFDTTTT